MQPKIDKKIFIFEIKAFEVVVTKSPYSYGNHGKIGKYWCRADFSSVSNPLTRWLPNGVLKQEFLDA